jgi:uncharacterized membrane protein
MSFRRPLRAQQFLLSMRELAATGRLRLVDAVLVSRDDRGHAHVRETVDLQPGRAALVGAMWAGLLGVVLAGPIGWLAGLVVGAGGGALAAKLIDRGVPDDWVRWFEEAVQPRTTTVVVLARQVDGNALAAEGARFPGAELIRTTINPGVLDRLAGALPAQES